TTCTYRLISCQSREQDSLFLAHWIFAGADILLGFPVTMENASNITNTSRRYDSFMDEYRLVMSWTLGMETVFMLVGTALNLWLMLSILTSRDLRVRMRNQLVVNMNAVHLVHTMFTSPVIILQCIAVLKRVFWSYEFFCHTYSIIIIIEFIQSFIADWLMVFIMCIFISNITDIDLASKVTPLVSRLIKATMHLLPWLVAIIVTPISISQVTRWYPCLLVPYKQLYIFETVYTVIPTCLTVLLMVAAVVLRFRRFSTGSSTASGNMGVQLLGKGPEIDNTFAYLLAAAVCVACEICHLVFVFEIMDWKYRGLRFEMVGYILSDSRVILMVFPWLLLPDIRQRIRNWRPWRREITGIDLTMAYGKETS
ncbi:hypothetical protein EGW08_003300, partial [Elysia chlorotica]